MSATLQESLENGSSQNSPLTNTVTGESPMDEFGEYKVEPLDGDGIKYLREPMFPPINELSPTKYYMNVYSLALEGAASSSADTMSEWSDRLDFADEKLPYRVAKRDGAGEEVEATARAGREDQTTYALTENAIRKRELKRRKNEERDRAQIISTLEKQMVSLYSLKKQYQRNTQTVGCQKEVVRLPSVVATDQLTRQRNAILEKIKRQKVQDGLKMQEQVERKLKIIEKLIKEQKYKGRIQVPIREFRKVNRYKTSETYEDDRWMNEDTENKNEQLDRFTDTIVEEVEIQPEYQDDQNNMNLGPDKTDVEPTVVAKEEAESFEKGTTRKGSAKKKDRKKKSVGETEKQNKKKKKKISADEEPAAICEETLELLEPTSQMQDLLLWFENWRENRREESRRFQEFELSKPPEERCIELRPAKAIFKDICPGTVLKQKVEVVNICGEALQCRVTGVQMEDITDKTPLIEAWLDGPQRAKTGNGWWLTVQLQAPGAVEDTETRVGLQFCRANGTNSVLWLPVEVLIPRAEPRLKTSCIRFVPQVFWAPDVFVTQLVVTNTGGLNCTVRWTEEKKSSSLFKRDSEVSVDCGTDADAVHMAREMIESAFANVFNVFRIASRQNQTVPARGHISLPVQFRPDMTSDKGDVFTKYTFTFQGERVDNGSQELVVCGLIEDLPFSVEPALLNLGVCYTGGMVQQAQVTVRSTARYACPVSTRLPRSLAGCLTVVPQHTVVQAHSTTTLAVRLVLSCGFLDKACAYFDCASGLLSVPLLVCVTLGSSAPAPPPLELRVMAVVAPPCPLTIEPALLDLGTVSTAETVVADIQLLNHQPFTYNYAFINLPPGVQVEPGGGCGSILPEEAMPLKLLFSPRACDLGARCERPGAEGAVTLNLRCWTSISYALPPLQYKLTPQKSKFSISNNYNVVLDSTTENNTQSSSAAFHIDEDGMVEIDKEVQEAPPNSPHTSNEESDKNEVTVEEVISKTSVHTTESELNQITEPDYEVLLEYYASYRLNGVAKLNGSSEEILCEDCRNIIDSGAAGDGFGANGTMKKATSDGNNEEMTEYFREQEEDITYRKPDRLTVSTALETELIDNEINEPLQRVGSGARVQPAPSQRFAELTLQAYVVDPLVELSSQAVVLPPTPCNSLALAPLYIRSKAPQKCRIHEKITNFKTWFEFKSPSRFLYVEPRRGFLTYNQKVKVNIIFKPRLTKKEIYDKAFEMKMESMKWTKIQELLDQYYQEQTKKQLKQMKGGSLKVSLLNEGARIGETKRPKSADTKKGKDKKRSKGSVVTTKTKKTKASLKSTKLVKKDSGPLAEVRIDPAEVEVTAEDLGVAEVWLLKYLEPLETSTKVSCVIVTELPSGIRRHETLDCEVLCSIVAPTLALTSTPCLQFGATALGVRSRLQATVTSLSFFDQFVTISTLNPIGPFWCPIPMETPLKGGGGGLELPPEHTLTIPVLFEPTFSGEVNENFEIISGSTILHLQAKGKGVIPTFSFTPDQQVFSVTCAAGKTSDIVIKIENTCAAPLQFKVRQDLLKEGSSLPPYPAQDTPASSPKQKGKPKEKKKKSTQEIITPELLECLENEFVNLTENMNTEPIFQILNTNESVYIPSKEIRPVTVRFTPSVNKKDLTVTEEASSQKTKGKSSGKDKNEPGDKTAKTNKKTKDKVTNMTVNKVSDTKETAVTKQPNITATKYTVIYGNVKVVKEWIFLATIKK